MADKNFKMLCHYRKSRQTSIHLNMTSSESVFHRRFSSNAPEIGQRARNYNQPRNNQKSQKLHGQYPSAISAQKYGKIDAQLQSISNIKNGHHLESQLIRFLQSNQFNNAVHIFHIMMQQNIKLKNVSLFPSILQSIKLSKSHNFHILELIEYTKHNRIQLDANKYAEILGICVSKNDAYSAKQIAILWSDAMPTFPILPLIHCLSSSQHISSKQAKIWQSVLDELKHCRPATPNEQQQIIKPTSTQVHVSQILSNLTAKNVNAAIQNLHELHSLNLPMDKKQNKEWNEWLLREELMSGDMDKIERNETLKILQQMGLSTNLNLNKLMTDNQLSTTTDHVHELERRLPFILQFISHNIDNGVIDRTVITSKHWMEDLISFILQISIKTNTSTVSKTLTNDLFAFMDKHYTEDNLLFHRQLFNQLRNEILSQHHQHTQKSKKQKNNFGNLSLRKLFQILNGFSKKQIENMQKMHELRYDLIPLCTQCPTELFYAKSKFLNIVRSKDLTDAIIESAFRFETEQLGHLLYYLFYQKTPQIIDSSSDAAMMFPLQIDWIDLQKIYGTILGLRSKAMNHLKDIDVMHLMHYAPLPVPDVSDCVEETDSIKLIRKRQQRVLQLLTGIHVKQGSFENVMSTLFYFEHDSKITANMVSFGTFYLNETLLHCFTVNCPSIRCNHLTLTLFF